jgi:ferritin-like metal-binding protein YciE
MPAKSLQHLFVEELRDMYDGEKRLLRALPKMAKAAESSDLQAAFTTHLRETERQVTRLEQVFRTVGQKPRGKTCHGFVRRAAATMGLAHEKSTRGSGRTKSSRRRRTTGM